jgi:hypothetical protein
MIGWYHIIAMTESPAKRTSQPGSASSTCCTPTNHCRHRKAQLIRIGASPVPNLSRPSYRTQAAVVAKPRALESGAMRHGSEAQCRACPNRDSYESGRTQRNAMGHDAAALSHRQRFALTSSASSSASVREPDQRLVSTSSRLLRSRICRNEEGHGPCAAAAG